MGAAAAIDSQRARDRSLPFVIPLRNVHQNLWLLSALPQPVGSSDALSSSMPSSQPAPFQQWSTSVFDHRRFPSQPTSTQSRSPDVPSPVGTGNYSAGAHHRSGSAASASELDKGAFASSPLNSGFVRRHQSLNHHSGRQMASRLASRSQELSGHSNVEPTSPSIGSHMEYAYRTNAHNGSGSPSAPSPISPSFASAPWNQHGEGITANITSPSRFANAFPSESRAAPGGAYRERGSSLSSNSHSLMDIHSNLARMDINTSILPVRGDSTDSGSTVTPTSAVGGPHSSLPSRPGLGSRNSASDVPRLSPNPPSARKLPSLITNRDVLARSAAGGGANIFGGPASAAAFVPPIGHAHTRQQSSDSPLAFMPRDPKAAALTAKRAEETDAFMGPFSAHAAPGWTQREMIVGRNEPGSPRGPGQHPELGLSWGLGLSPSTANLDKGNMNSLALSMAQAQQHRTAMLQAQAGMSPNGNAMLGMGANTGSPGPNRGGGGETSSNNSNFSLATPVDFSSLAAQKGYNPLAFDLSPPFARYFVIKSYTEDDVHKSLKYEIWASTEKGNQRLDRAWRESAGRGPIYLFFSVNASGHFCGMAQMLTPVDMSTSANVWAVGGCFRFYCLWKHALTDLLLADFFFYRARSQQDGKWKGTFKVRWIYVKDLPNNQLRHIRLTNTPEVKPVTQSRDTQELTAAAGTEVLRIMAEYPASEDRDLSFRLGDKV